MKKELIRLEHVSKSFDGHQVLDGLDLTINENEFVTLLGPSGCGKTTTLRLIAGFEEPDMGRILRWARYYPHAAKQTPCQYGVPELFPFFPHGCSRKYCLRTENPR